MKEREDYKLAPVEKMPNGSNLPPIEEYKGSESTPTHRRGENFREVASFAVVILIAFMIALVLVLFVFQSYQVDGPSMMPTLMNNDRLIVWKLPRTWARITGHTYIPKRGDIIVFDEPSLDNKQLIKRVIGLPGDRVVVKNNVITVYNSAHPKGFDPDTTLPYFQQDGISVPVTTGNIDVTIPAGEVYVCGDNRPDSLDSRYFGAVPANDIIGQLVVRVVPVSKAKVF